MRSVDLLLGLPMWLEYVVVGDARWHWARVRVSGSVALLHFEDWTQVLLAPQTHAAVQKPMQTKYYNNVYDN